MKAVSNIYEDYSVIKHNIVRIYYTKLEKREKVSNKARYLKKNKLNSIRYSKFCNGNFYAHRFSKIHKGQRLLTKSSYDPIIRSIETQVLRVSTISQLQRSWSNKRCKFINPTKITSL